MSGSGPVYDGAEPRTDALRQRSERKRQAIIDSAVALFLEHGYLATTMDEVAESAGVSKPTVYKFFGDKHGLFVQIVVGALDRVGEPFRTQLAELVETTHLEVDLRRVARRYLATVTVPAVLQLRRLVIGASHQVPEVASLYYEKAPEQTMRALAHTFEQLSRRGLLEIGDPLMAASHFAFLVLGRALDKSLFCGDKPFSDRELTAQADAGVDVFLAAYAVRR